MRRQVSQKHRLLVIMSVSYIPHSDALSLVQKEQLDSLSFYEVSTFEIDSDSQVSRDVVHKTARAEDFPEILS